MAEFTSPSGVSNGSTPFTFMPTTTVTLSANTEYWVVAEHSTRAWINTSQDAEDAGAESGWSIANVGQSRSDTSTGSFADRTNGNAYKLRVNGTVNPIRVLVSNIAQTSGGTSDLAYLDVAQDFMTGENDAGYTLGEIEITLQGAGVGNPPTVTLHSETVTGLKLADFTGPSSLVIGSAINYIYVPITTVTLNKSTIYYVVIQGGDGLRTYTTSSSEDFVRLAGASRI